MEFFGHFTSYINSRNSVELRNVRFLNAKYQKVPFLTIFSSKKPTKSPERAEKGVLLIFTLLRELTVKGSMTVLTFVLGRIVVCDHLDGFLSVVAHIEMIL